MAGTVDPVLDDLKDEAETKVAVGDVAAAQDVAFANDGRYEQKIKKPESLADGDADGAVHVYESPKGHGYAIEWYAKKGKDELWKKAQNFGPEDYRSFDWFEVPEDPLVKYGTH